METLKIDGWEIFWYTEDTQDHVAFFPHARGADGKIYTLEYNDRGIWASIEDQFHASPRLGRWLGLLDRSELLRVRGTIHGLPGASRLGCVLV